MSKVIFYAWELLFISMTENLNNGYRKSHNLRYGERTKLFYWITSILNVLLGSKLGWISVGVPNFESVRVLVLFIFPSTYDGKIQWSTSGIENVADFCHFVT